MNIKQLAFVAVALCCLGFSALGLAGQKLDAINAQVEAQAADIDQKHGVLLDSSERNDLKLQLISRQALADATDGQSIKDIAATANRVYEISDPYEQRQLLIKIEAQTTVQKGTGNSSNEPPNFP